MPYYINKIPEVEESVADVIAGAAHFSHPETVKTLQDNI